MSTAPSSFHQWIVGRLWRYIGIPAEDLGLAYSFDAPIGVLMPGCDPVQPDFVVVLAGHAAIIKDRRIRGVPDLLVEILSPGNSPYDQEVKLRAYERAGVPEYLIVDPAQRTLTLYRLAEPGRYATSVVLAGDEMVRLSCLPAITFRAGDLFAGAPDTTL